MSMIHRISSFHGVVVLMEYTKKYGPHVIAICEEGSRKKGIFSIDSAELIDVVDGEFDDFPFKERKLISGWIILRRKELLDNWKELSNNSFPRQIQGLS